MTWPPNYVASPLEVRSPDESFPCLTLRCRLPAGDCVARQVESEVRTQQARRGQAPPYPMCTVACADGRGIRARLLPFVSSRREGGIWHGHRLRYGEESARRRLELRGLLAPVPSLDEPPR